MGNKGRSEPNLFGGYTHYDENGKKIGRSEPNLFGGFTEYDANGKKIGTSDPNIWGGFNHYDEKGHKTGSSDPGLFGGIVHYDSDGHRIGTSNETLLGNYSHSGSGSGFRATVDPLENTFSSGKSEPRSTGASQPKRAETELAVFNSPGNEDDDEPEKTTEELIGEYLEYRTDNTLHQFFWTFAFLLFAFFMGWAIVRTVADEMAGANADYALPFWLGVGILDAGFFYLIYIVYKRDQARKRLEVLKQRLSARGETGVSYRLEEAIRRQKKSASHILRWVASFLAAGAVIAAILFVIFSARYQKDQKYQSAIAQYDAGNYATAMDAFTDLDKHKDAEAFYWLCKSHIEYEEAKIKDAEISCSIAYNHYGFKHLDTERLEEIKTYYQKVSRARIVYEEQSERASEAALEQQIRTGVPFVGMWESRIADTSLGKPSEKVRHNSAGDGKRANIYDFKNLLGKTVFTARCVDGKVTQVWDYREEAKKNPYPTTRGKIEVYEPEVDDFDDPEDFYYHYYDDFYDYYDARDYYYEHGGN